MIAQYWSGTVDTNFQLDSCFISFYQALSDKYFTTYHHLLLYIRIDELITFLKVPQRLFLFNIFSRATNNLQNLSTKVMCQDSFFLGTT